MRPFAGLCADVLDDLPATGSSDPDVVITAIARWRRFWSVSRDGLSRENRSACSGSCGSFSSGSDPSPSERSPLGGAHSAADTIRDRTNKCGGQDHWMSAGPLVHRIHGLDQLAEPGAGTLYLLSIRAIPDPLGEHTLDDLIRQAQAVAQEIGPAAAGALDDRLTAGGFAVHDVGRYSDRVRVTTQDLFRVDETFPRLTPVDFPAGLPPGVGDISYALDTNACRTWRVAVRPNDDGPLAMLGRLPQS